MDIRGGYGEMRLICITFDICHGSFFSCFVLRLLLTVIVLLVRK